MIYGILVAQGICITWKTEGIYVVRFQEKSIYRGKQMLSELSSL